MDVLREQVPPKVYSLPLLPVLSWDELRTEPPTVQLIKTHYLWTVCGGGDKCQLLPLARRVQSTKMSVFIHIHACIIKDEGSLDKVWRTRSCISN